MAKVKLMPKDEDKLIDAMRMFADTLEDIGLQTSMCVWDMDGAIIGSFAIENGATINIGLTNDGDGKVIRYKYA